MVPLEFATNENVPVTGPVTIVDDLTPFGLPDAVGNRKEIEELPDFHAVVHAKIVGHVSDAAPHRHGIASDAMSVDGPFAKGRFEQRRQESDGGTFAGAIGSDEPEHFAGTDI